MTTRRELVTIAAAELVEDILEASARSGGAAWLSLIEASMSRLLLQCDALEHQRSRDLMSRIAPHMVKRKCK